MPIQKIVNNLPKLATAHIERNELAEALRAAQFRFDRQLHDLRSEFINREAKLRDEYLAETAGLHAETAE